FALTSQWFHGDHDATDCQPALDALFAKWFPPPPKAIALLSGPGLDSDDGTIIKRAIEARNGGRFRQLWGGDITGYSSPSEADLALATRIGFWTGPDVDRIWRIIRQSGLHREKWEREDYARRTI